MNTHYKKLHGVKTMEPFSYGASVRICPFFWE